MKMCSNSNFIVWLESGKVRKYDFTSTLVSTVAGSTNGYQDGTGTAAKFWGPTGMDISKDCSYVWVADYYNNRIRKVDLSSGLVTTVVGSGSATTAANLYGTAVGIPKPLRLVFSPTSNTAYVYAASTVKKTYAIDTDSTYTVLLKDPPFGLTEMVVYYPPPQ